jgi:hypothetical protein
VGDHNTGVTRRLHSERLGSATFAGRDPDSMMVRTMSCNKTHHFAVQNVWASVALLAVILALPQLGLTADPEPGPESGGLRLRFAATPRSGEGFDVRIDVLNISNRPITLHTDWQGEASGSLKDYLEAATSIECEPAIEPWRGGTQATPNTPTQSTQELKAGESLSISWQTSTRRLKNRVSHPARAENPVFPYPGLYSVHARLDLLTDKGKFRLRSNEQLVSVGGSVAMPKHTYGQLWSVNPERLTATLGLGSLHQVQVGDQFDMSSKQDFWRLTITEVSDRFSQGKLTRVDDPAENPSQPPRPFTNATLRQDREK